MSAPHPSRLALDRLALGQGDAAARAHADSCAQCAAHLRALSVQSGQPDFVHPSSLALDRFALGIADAPTQAHTAACAQCAAHLTEVQRELPVPTWVRELEGPRAPAWPWLRPLLAMGAVAAVLVVALAIPRPRPDELTAKGVGTPQVQVWVNREGHVGVWDGRALQVNDALRFQVRPGSFTHLTVVELQAGKLYRVLHAAPVAGDGLSPAWQVDAEGAQEEVVLLMSNAPLSEEELQRALAGQASGPVWSNHWKFEKEVR